MGAHPSGSFGGALRTRAGRPQVGPRQCGTCALCCKLLRIAEIEKPMGQWCPHCRKQGGCTIYDARPAECRTFNCSWLITPEIDDAWQPTRSRMVLHHVIDGAAAKLVVHVDPGSPLAWRNEPYYSQLKAWARRLEEQNGLVNVYVGRRVIVVLPDREVDLGPFALGDGFSFQKRRAGAGWDYEFTKVSQGA